MWNDSIFVNVCLFILCRVSFALMNKIILFFIRIIYFFVSMSFGNYFGCILCCQMKILHQIPSISLPIYLYTYLYDSYLRSDCLVGPKALDPNHYRQPTLWLHDLCLKNLTVQCTLMSCDCLEPNHSTYGYY